MSIEFDNVVAISKLNLNLSEYDLGLIIKELYDPIFPYLYCLRSIDKAYFVYSDSNTAKTVLLLLSEKLEEKLPIILEKFKTVISLSLVENPKELSAHFRFVIRNRRVIIKDSDLMKPYKRGDVFFTIKKHEKYVLEGIVEDIENTHQFLLTNNNGKYHIFEELSSIQDFKKTFIEEKDFKIIEIIDTDDRKKISLNCFEEKLAPYKPNQILFSRNNGKKYTLLGLDEHDKIWLNREDNIFIECDFTKIDDHFIEEKDFQRCLTCLEDISVNLDCSKKILHPFKYDQVFYHGKRKYLLKGRDFNDPRVYWFWGVTSSKEPLETLVKRFDNVIEIQQNSETIPLYIDDENLYPYKAGQIFYAKKTLHKTILTGKDFKERLWFVENRAITSYKIEETMCKFYTEDEFKEKIAKGQSGKFAKHVSYKGNYSTSKFELDTSDETLFPFKYNQICLDKNGFKMILKGRDIIIKVLVWHLTLDRGVTYWDDLYDYFDFIKKGFTITETISDVETVDPMFIIEEKETIIEKAETPKIIETTEVKVEKQEKDEVYSEIPNTEKKSEPESTLDKTTVNEVKMGKLENVSSQLNKELISEINEKLRKNIEKQMEDKKTLENCNNKLINWLMERVMENNLDILLAEHENNPYKVKMDEIDFQWLKKNLLDGMFQSNASKIEKWIENIQNTFRELILMIQPQSLELN